MIETLAARARRARRTPPRCSGQDARAAPRHARGRGRGAGVPFTTGILVGIGETRAERIDALVAIPDAHARHGHVQEVIVQNFLPKLGTVDAQGAAVPTRRVAVVDRGRAARSCAKRSMSRHHRT